MPTAIMSETALRRCFIGYTLVDEEHHFTISSFYSSVQAEIQRIVQDYLNDNREWKIQACLQVVVSKGENERPAHFHNPTTTLKSYSVANEMQEMERRMDECTEKGSGWRLARVEKLELRLAQFNSIPFHVGHAPKLNLPPKLALKQACVNIVGAPDGECFKFAVLSVLHYGDILHDRQRASKYTPWLEELNFSRILFPFQAKDLPRFEYQNPAIAINLLEWNKNGHATLARGSPVTEYRQVINILIIDKHYVGVVNLNRLLNNNNSHGNHSRKYCDLCLRPFVTQATLDDHLLASMKNQQRQYNMPPAGKNNLTFSNYAKTISPTHVIYSDIECMIMPGGEHCPIMCGYLLIPNSNINALQHTQPVYRSFVGRDCIRQLLSNLCNLVESLCAFNEEYGREKMKPLSPFQQDTFNNCRNCYLCKKSFNLKEKSEEKVRDHDHFSGDYIGPACARCNLSRRNRRSSFPIIFHNLRGYDAHHIVKEGVGYFPSWNLSVIPITKEGYLSLKCSFGKDKGTLQFIDSLQFLSASLATLVRNCPSLPLTSSLPGSSQVKSGKGSVSIFISGFGR